MLDLWVYRGSLTFWLVRQFTFNVVLKQLWCRFRVAVSIRVDCNFKDLFFRRLIGKHEMASQDFAWDELTEAQHLFDVKYVFDVVKLTVLACLPFFEQIWLNLWSLQLGKRACLLWLIWARFHLAQLYWAKRVFIGFNFRLLSTKFGTFSSTFFRWTRGRLTIFVFREFRTFFYRF